MTIAATTAAHQVEAAIIGAGVIGLAVARALALKGKEVLLLEKESSYGSATSSRNSEVLHAGLYYSPPTSLKSTLCVRGQRLLYKFCDTHNIPYMKCGKIVVATSEEQRDVDLQWIREKAQRNGVKDLRLLSMDDVKALEPEVQSFGGLWSPSTGVIDSHSLMVGLLGDAEANGSTLALQSPVKGGRIDPGSDNIILQVEGMELACSIVVNCAGLHAHQIAKLIIGEETTPRQYFAKGNYYRLTQKTPFRHLVYPVPQPGGLGVHATIDLGGQTRFGPDVEWIPMDTTPDRIDLDVLPNRTEAFYDQVRTYWPDLKDGSLVPDYAGIRPKVWHPDLGTPPVSDFVILGPRDHGIKGFVTMAGMESPGLTSCLAVAELVVEMLNQ